MNFKRRPATPAEIVEIEACIIKSGIRVRFRHFVREVNCPHAEHGVSHRQHSRSKLRVIDGVPHVRHHGELLPVTGDLIELDNGYRLIGDLRLDSKHL